jgi:bifunctional DNA-binding transcriptional regulator/antitoxin component of YhaV-PrlF toxin-antitoxin module
VIKSDIRTDEVVLVTDDFRLRIPSLLRELWRLKKVAKVKVNIEKNLKINIHEYINY